MKNSPGTEFLRQLLQYHQSIPNLKTHYSRLRALLQRVCKDLTADDPVEFSNLFSRLNFVCNKTKLSKKKKYLVNHFRVQANKVIRHGYIPGNEEYSQDLKALAQAISHFYSVPIPAALSAQLPKHERLRVVQRAITEKHTRIRVQVESWDKEYIYAIDEDHAAEELLKIRYGVEETNSEFNPTIAELWRGCQLNLVNTRIEEGIYYPEFIVLEPDYLIDVTSLAECFKEYGSHPLHYIYSKLVSVKNNKYILMGSAANFFLDEFINEKKDHPVDYNESIRKVFKASPLEFSTCKDFDNEMTFAYFIQDTKTHFANIKKTVNKTFRHPDHAIEKENSILEPAFLSELYGIQGRLDLLDSGPDASKIIELKSGKAPWPDDNHTLIADNHTVQAYLYSLVVQNVLQVPNDSLRTYIFYSKCDEGGLRLSFSSRSRLRTIINLRNLIVSAEKKIASDPSGMESKKYIDQIKPEILVGNKPGNRFLQQYVIPDIKKVQSCFDNASLLESDYFHSLYAFVTREHYLAKSGDGNSESCKGLSALWLSNYDEKLEAGEILTDLIVHENNMTSNPPTISFRIPEQDKNFLPNFRKGDIVVLYERNTPDDNASNKQVFKGTVQNISSKEICIRFRYKQRNESLFSNDNLYAVEPDMMDANFNVMYRGLYKLLGANKDRRDLLLGQRVPLRSPEMFIKGNYGSDEVNEIVRKAKVARDYFILVGPPGTGKTSLALRSMVEEFYLEPEQNILLLAYTNRAVEEICDALAASKAELPFIRIGNEISCEERHKDKLLDRVIASSNSREEVRSRISGYRIFVGTVASISGKTELFKLKNFPVAIVDEASQILEPQMLTILSALDAQGQNAIGKFILIGDHKQLPAVVIQPENDSRVTNARLLKIGLADRRNSLFERLYRLQKKGGNDLAWAMLHKQGRMHPEIAGFPNIYFYKNQLQLVPAPHQVAALEFGNYDENSTIEKLLATKRMLFIPSVSDEADQSAKINSCEAGIVSLLVNTVYTLYKKNGIAFDPKKSLGIIAPFRSQIALLRNKLHQLGIPELEQVTIDTVECFQGSQRDIIIFSFTANENYLLAFLSSTMKEDNMTIDRKLNVAITRARKQLFITGNPSILKNNAIYWKLMSFIRTQGGFVDSTPMDFMTGEFVIPEKEKTKRKTGKRIIATRSKKKTS